MAVLMRAQALASPLVQRSAERLLRHEQRLSKLNHGHQPLYKCTTNPFQFAMQNRRATYRRSISTALITMWVLETEKGFHQTSERICLQPRGSKLLLANLLAVHSRQSKHACLRISTPITDLLAGAPIKSGGATVADRGFGSAFTPGS